MSAKRFEIDKLMGDFLSKGFVDGDEIIVQKMKDHEIYIVREGNRRITAIKKLLKNKGETEKKRSGLCEELSVLPVTEVVQKNLTDEEYNMLIDHMLNVRHLGQLEKWKPFVRATKNYEAYLDFEPKMTKESFEWEDNSERANYIAVKFLHDLGSNLIPNTKRTKERLQTVRVMEQLKETEGVFIRPNYYSLFSDFIHNSTPQLSKYLPRDEKTFLFTDEAKDKVIKLCALNFANRKIDGVKPSSINKSQQWNFLSKILNEEDNTQEEITEMVHEVLENENQPEGIWRNKEAERRSYSWKEWLEEITSLLISVKLEDIHTDDVNTKTIIGRLWEVVDKLKEKTSGGKQ